jgi:hypothetical protein
MAEATDATIPNEVRSQLKTLLAELERRAQLHQKLDCSYEGDAPIPEAIVRARVTKSYRHLMPISGAPWGSLVVDSTQDRLEVSGIRSEDKHADELAWRLWQENFMDDEGSLAHQEALIDGRAFALVWREPGSSIPEVSIDNSATMAVMYREGSRRERIAALRWWVEDDGKQALTLYTKDYVWKFVEPRTGGQDRGRIRAGDRWWERRETRDEPWPLRNPYGVIPGVELAVNRRVKQGIFPLARGEYAHCLGLIDRIELLTFLGLVVAFWMGFPLRGIIGEKLLKDDDGNPIPPFDAHASGIAVLENPNAKPFEYEAADRKNLSIFAELDQLSSITKTPRHYFPTDKAFSNISADAIRASEGGLHAKVTKHKRSLGRGNWEIMRLLALMSDEELSLPARATVEWQDHESRSMAERADAATKLASIGIPVPMVAERYLNFSQSDVGRLEGLLANSVFRDLSEAAISAAKEEAVAARLQQEAAIPAED